MPKLLMLKGLPGSGKSYYAAELVNESTNQWKRVEKDMLREMVDCSKHSKGNESLILKARDSLIRLWLSEGKHVVVSDTGFAPYHETALRAIAAEFGARFEVKLIDTPLEVCIERDAKRDNPVGAAVIRGMYNKHLAPVKPESRTKYVYQDKSLKKAILVDLDGNLTLINPDNPRSPFDMTRVSEDLLHEPTAMVVKALVQAHPDLKVIYCSGRDQSAREDSVQWLMKHGLWENDDSMDCRYSLIMRSIGDNRRDSVVKRELYELYVKDTFQVLLVLDDRTQVIRECWRDIGLPCFQTAEGDF